MKQVLQPDHIPLNNYILRVVGLPDLQFVTIGGLEEELENVDLPDRTAASGGHTKTIEFEAALPLHHRLQQAAMETWYADSQEPVAIDYKKTAILTLPSLTNLVQARFTIIGMFPCKRKTGDLDMNNEGELHVVMWTFKADRVQPT